MILFFSKDFRIHWTEHNLAPIARAYKHFAVSFLFPLLLFIVGRTTICLRAGTRLLELNFGMLSSKQPPFSVIEARISFTTRELGMLVIMKDNPEKRAVVVLPPPPPVIDFVFSAESSTEFRRRLCCCTLWVDFRRLSAVFLDFVAVEICFCGVKDTSIVLAVAWTDEVRRIRMFDAFAFLPNDLEALVTFSSRLSFHLITRCCALSSPLMARSCIGLHALHEL